MPADPVEFRIVQNLQTALLAISIAGGYHYDVAALAVKLDPNHSVDQIIGEQKLRPFLVLAIDPNTFTYRPARRTRVVLPITIHAVHDSDPTNDLSWMQTWFRLCADVEQAIAIDIHRGGLAQETVIASRDYRLFGGRQVWAMVSGEIRVERIYGAPNG